MRSYGNSKTPWAWLFFTAGMTMGLWIIGLVTMWWVVLKGAPIWLGFIPALWATIIGAVVAAVVSICAFVGAVNILRGV